MMLKIVKKQHGCRIKIRSSEFTVKSMKTVGSITMQGDLILMSRGRLHKISPFWQLGHVRNVCFLTGRTRAITQKLHLSRMMIREFGNAGFFGGFKKSSW